MKTFQIITRGGIGDGLLLTPTVRTIKQLYPDSRIKLYCISRHHYDIFLNNPYVDVLRLATFRSAPLAVVIQRLWPKRYIMPYYGMSFPGRDLTRHATEAFGEYCEIQVTDRKLEIFFTDEEESWAREFVARYHNPVVIQVESVASKNKHWAVSNWEHLVARNPQYAFLQLGVGGEVRIDGAVDLRGRTTVRQAIAILKYAKSFVGVESALAHATNAVNTPGVVLFGPTEPELVGYPNNIAVVGNAACAPCIVFSVPHPCPYDTACMKSIAVEQVEQALNAQVKRREMANFCQREAEPGDRNHVYNTASMA